LPPNLHFQKTDDGLDLNIVTASAPSTLRTALSNSFGFGGTNASLIFKAAE